MSPSSSEDVTPSSSSDSAPAVAARSLTRTYRGSRRTPPRTALDAVTLAVAARRWTSLLGPNGSGKSTLLRLIVGHDRPTSGTIEVLGNSVGNGREAQRRKTARQISMVFQHPGLDPLLTVAENLEIQAALLGASRSESRRLAYEAADTLNIADRMSDRVGSLSGGLARRTDIARALIQKPTLLILDEPTTGLDHTARMDVLSRLRELVDNERMTLLMSTHLMDEAERSDEVIMLDEGRVVAAGTPESLKHSHARRVATISVDGAKRSAVMEMLQGLEFSPTEVEGAIRVTISDEADPDGAERLAASLAREGLAFAFGPPTLGHAYQSLTGKSLSGQNEKEFAR